MVDAVIVILTAIIVAILIHSWRKNRVKVTTDQKLMDIKAKLIRVDPRAESVEFFTNAEEAYTLDKREVHMCVHEPSGNYYPDNTLMYIALHELAHALIPYDTSKHPPEFDKLFSQLKDRAAYLKLYDPNIPFPNEYCGKKLSYY